jgi:hypothetical protein
MNDDKYAKLRELLAKLEAIFVEYDASWDADTKSKGLPIGDFMSIMDMLRPFIDDHSSLLADLDAATRERDDIKSNVENAVRCAKEYCPNYPWTLNTASEAVWATGESYKGVSAARDDLHKDLDAATADLKAVSAALDGLAEHNVKLRTENAKLREALEPFAKMGDTRFVGSAWEGKPDVPIIFHSATGVGVTPGDFYLARTTLGGHQ